MYLRELEKGETWNKKIEGVYFFQCRKNSCGGNALWEIANNLFLDTAELGSMQAKKLSCLDRQRM